MAQSPFRPSGTPPEQAGENDERDNAAHVDEVPHIAESRVVVVKMDPSSQNDRFCPENPLQGTNNIPRLKSARSRAYGVST